MDANEEHLSVNFLIPTGGRMDPQRQGSNSILHNSVSGSSCADSEHWWAGSLCRGLLHITLNKGHYSLLYLRISSELSR